METWKRAILGAGALLASTVLLTQAGLSNDRPGYRGYERPGAADARAGSEALRQQRALESMRQSQSIESQRRAAEQRERAMQQRIDDARRSSR
jgi:hypothetical protein